MIVTAYGNAYLYNNKCKFLHVNLLSSDYLVLVGRAAEDRMSTMWNKRQCTYNVNIEVRSCNNFCSGNAILVTYSERVSVALVIQHAKRMRRTVTRGRSGCTIFSTLSKKRHDFRGEIYYGA